uniref:Uncharacterized protein n=1 Tax=Oryza rufipogon TaxID=4529 RepID=A0A0E0PH29_ORYRU
MPIMLDFLLCLISSIPSFTRSSFHRKGFTRTSCVGRRAGRGWHVCLDRSYIYIYIYIYIDRGGSCNINPSSQLIKLRSIVIESEQLALATTRRQNGRDGEVSASSLLVRRRRPNAAQAERPPERRPAQQRRRQRLPLRVVLRRRRRKAKGQVVVVDGEGRRRRRPSCCRLQLYLILL